MCPGVSSAAEGKSGAGKERDLREKILKMESTLQVRNRPEETRAVNASHYPKLRDYVLDGTASFHLFSACRRFDRHL